jgi:hypothetical protein
MQSEHLDALAAALAKAQAELKNPAKSKTGKIRSEKASYEYQYVDFADGLDIIRQTLGANGLSFLQLTDLDGEVVTLRTRLLHASGQWIESTYPVCRTGAHQAMGAALTYARRYALFSLIGIAGEDDTDGEQSAEASARYKSRAAEEAAEKAKAEAQAYHDQQLAFMRELESKDSIEANWNAERVNRSLHFKRSDDPLLISLKEFAAKRGSELAKAAQAEMVPA